MQKRKSIIDISSDVATTTGREAWWLLNCRAASNSKGASYTQFSSYCSGTMSQQQYTINDFKSTVNSFLYRLNGSKTHHQDPTRLSSVDTRFSSAWTMALEFSHTIYGIANYQLHCWSHKLEKGQLRPSCNFNFLGMGWSASRAQHFCKEGARGMFPCDLHHLSHYRGLQLQRLLARASRCDCNYHCFSHKH